MTTDAMHCPDNQRCDRWLHPHEDGLKEWGIDAIRYIKPRKREHQKEARKHKPETRKQGPDASACDHTEVHTQFMRLRSRQRLIDRKHSIELLRTDPFFLFH